MLSLSTTTLLLRKWSKSLLCFFPVKTNVMQWLDWYSLKQQATMNIKRLAFKWIRYMLVHWISPMEDSASL